MILDDNKCTSDLEEKVSTQIIMRKSFTTDYFKMCF